MTGTDYTVVAPKCACGNSITKFFSSGKPGKFCAVCRDKQMGKHRIGERHIACAQCAKPITTKLPHQKFCSYKCNYTARDRAYGHLPKQYRPIVQCNRCGAAFKPKRAEYTSYCSRECAFEDIRARRSKGVEPPLPSCPVFFNPCPGCGAIRALKTNSTSICRACRAAASKVKFAIRGALMRDPRTERQCRCCAKKFTPTYGDKRIAYCTDTCATRMARRIRGSDSHRSRALRAGVEYELVSKIRVFDRDGWRCQICGRRTPRARMGSMADIAPELDHRVPLSKGGGHLYANVQCACRRCNREKGNRNCAGQLPMFEA